MEIQNQIDALNERIIELENKPQIPGPQGKPGNIEAAVHNAEQAATKIAQDAETRYKESISNLTHQVMVLQKKIVKFDGSAKSNESATASRPALPMK